MNGHEPPSADLLDAIRRCYASLYTARAVSYREDMGIGQSDVALSACIQRMVRSDLSSSGVWGRSLTEPSSSRRSEVIGK